MATSRWWVDLSWPIREGFGELPGHPPTRLEPFHRHETHGRSNVYLSMSIHSSTHLDAPYHFYPNGATVDQLPLDALCCPALLLDLGGEVAPGAAIERQQLQQQLALLGAPDVRGRALVIRTGWAEAKYGGIDYYTENPYLSADAAQWLATTGAHLVGIDFPPDAIGKQMVIPAPSPVHEALLGAGVCILENLANLEKLPEKSFELLCLPLKLRGEGGAPARALARSLL